MSETFTASESLSDDHGAAESTTRSFAAPTLNGVGADDRPAQSVLAADPDSDDTGMTPRSTQEVNAADPHRDTGSALWTAGGYLTGARPPQEDAAGVLIPTAYFRSVDGVVVNEDGELIDNAQWLVAQDGLPTAAPVENGQFRIDILRVAYENFILLAESEQPNLDYVWYQFDQEVIDTRRDESVVLRFEESEVSSGLTAGLTQLGN